VWQSDNGTLLTTGTMICDPSVAGKVIPHSESFRNGTARLSFVVPASAKGKLLKAKLTIKVGTQSTTRIASFRVSGPTLKAVIGAPSASPAKAVAGKRLTVAFPVRRSDNGKPLKTGTMICDPSVAGKVIPHAERFKDGTARLSFTIPASAKGKLLKVKVTIKVGKQSTTRIATFRVSAPSAPSAPRTGANRAPHWPSAVSWKAATVYSYDGAGALVSAVTTVKISAAVDPDGDALSYSWSASNGSIVGHGLTATWQRKVSGHAVQNGDVVVTANDGHGGTGRYTLRLR
jgi:hypothetical protein